MSGDWERVCEVFDQVAGLPDGERRRRLEALTAGDPEVRDEVESLLAHDQGAPAPGPESFPEGSPEAIVQRALEGLGEEGSAADRPPEERWTEDHQLGPYRVIRELGRGGLGVVYLAEHTDPTFPLKAAVKVLRRPFPGFLPDGTPPPSDPRFDRERRILALLSHPHIAQIYDSGYTDRGTPYLVMELVDGEAIDRFADRHRLGLEERLGLVLQVVDAMAYAHRNLVIHRDLKPSNILVAESDPEAGSRTGPATRESGEGAGGAATGRVKLLDFGISKILEPETGDASLEAQDGIRAPGPLTRPGELLLTPEYASPEQVRGGSLTTAVDQYALGVLLYRLLTGLAPYHFESYRPGEIERVVTSAPIAPPSTAVARYAAEHPDEARAAAEARGLTPRRWVRRLSGDLDRIVGVALRREPERRYASVEALGQDLQAFLDGRPVKARGDSLPYRAGKFLGRHRGALAAAALVLLSLVAGLATTFWQMRQAQVERQRAGEVADFFVGLFESADPAVARGDELTVRQLLDQGSRDLLAGAGHSDAPPEVAPALMTTIGRVYRQLGLYEPSEELLLAAHDRWLDLEGTGGVDERRIAVSLGELGHLYDAWERHDEAAAHLLEALALLEAGGPPADHRQERATLLLRLASVRTDQRHLEEAEELLDEALALRRREHGAGAAEVPAEVPAEGAAEIAEVRHSLAQVWVRQGRLEEAERTLSEILVLRRRVLGEDHPLVLTTWNDLGAVLHDHGDYRAAADTLGRVVSLRRRVLGSDHPFLATALLNHALVSRKAGDLGAAAASLEEALALQRQVFGEEHPRIATSLSELAKIHQAEGDLPAARERFEEALAMRRRLLGPEHLEVARSHLELAGLARDQDRPRRAEELLRRGLALQEGALGPDDPALSFALVPLGQVLREQGRCAEALPLLERGEALRRQGLPDDHWRRAEVEVELALCRRALGRPVDPGRACAALEVLARDQGEESGPVRRLRAELPGCPASAPPET